MLGTCILPRYLGKLLPSFFFWPQECLCSELFTPSPFWDSLFGCNHRLQSVKLNFFLSESNWTYDVDLTSPSSDRMIQPGITDKWCTVPSNKYRLSNYLGHLTINYPTTLQILNEYLCLSPCQSTLSSARIFFFFPNMVKIQFLLCLKALSGFPPCTGRRQVLSQEPSDCPCSS